MLRTFDRYGNRIDEVEFHPAWHKLMQMGVETRAALAAVDERASRPRTPRARRCT